jgi:hypothetical protein
MMSTQRPIPEGLASSQSQVIVALPAPISTKYLTGGGGSLTVVDDVIDRDFCFFGFLGSSSDGCRLEEERVVMLQTSSKS